MGKQEDKAVAMGLFQEGGMCQLNGVLRTACPIQVKYFYTITIVTMKTLQARIYAQ